MKRRSLNHALGASVAVVLTACDIFYVAHASVPLVAPIDTSCLRSTLERGGGPRRPQRAGGQAAGDQKVSVYSTPAMFHNRWETIAQVSERDSSFHLGKVYRDSSASLHASIVQVNRRFAQSDVPLTSAQLAASLLDVRDACGGQSPGAERLFSVEINEWPYETWAVRGTNSRAAMRLTVRDRRYHLQWPSDEGRFVLHADTMADQTAASYPKWIEVDSVELPSPPKGATRATECWRGDSLPTGNILAYVRRTETQYFKDVLQAWALDRAAFRLRSVSPDRIECLNTQWGSVLPHAPRVLRATALTFHPAPGMARIYAYLSFPDFPTDYAIPTIAIDSQIVGRVEGGSFLMVEVAPGRHRVSTPAGRHESVLALEALADSSYFVELRKIQLSWNWRASVRPMDPVKAHNAIRTAHMVPSSWPGSPMETLK
jgi:hypothetical protein